MAAQVGSAFVAVMPSFRGFRKEVDSEVGAAAGASAKTFSSKMGAGGASAGSSLGKGVKAGFNGAASNLGASELKQLQGDVSKAASAYSTAVSKNADALGKVRVAQAALNDVKGKGDATSAQLARAEENLAAAQRKAADAASNLKTRGEAVTSSRNALKAAEESAAAATDRAAASAQKSGGYFSRLKTAFVEGAPSARDYGDAVEHAGGSMKGFALGGAVAGAVSSVTSSITGSLGLLATEAVNASDATDKFKGTLKFAGLDTSTIDAVSAKTRKYADDTVYDLGDIQNMTAQLAANGVPNFEELGEAAGNLNAIAGGNAETFKSVGMVMSQTAGAGKLTTENWNQLSDAIPGASGKIQEALLKNGAYTGNFRDAMEKGQITADEFNTAIMELGTQPVAVEAAKSTETFEGMLGNLKATIVGGLSDALNNMKPQLGDLVTRFTDLAANALPAVVGAAKTAAEVLTGLMDFVSQNGDWLGPLVIGIGVFAAAFKAVTFVQGVITAWKVATESMTAAQWLMNAALNANPIGIIIGLIVALVAGLIWFFTQTDTGKAIWAGFIEWLQSAWQGIVDFATGLWGGLSDFFTGVWEGISTGVTNAWNGIMSFFQAIGATISAVWTAIWSVLKPILEVAFQVVSTIIGVYIAIWKGIFVVLVTVITVIFQTIANVIMVIWNTIVAFLTPIINGIVLVVQTALGVISAVWTTVWGAISGFFMTVWNGIVAFLTPIVETISSVIGAVLGVIAGIWNAVWGGISSFFTGVWDGIVGFVTGYINTVQAIISGVLGVISGIWNSIWSGISGFFMGIWNGIVSAVQTIGGVFQSAFSGIAGFVQAAFSGVIGAVKGPINGVIGIVNSAIRALNGLHVTIPDWVPGVGGQTWGINIPSIPALADGATVLPKRGGTLAMLAEAGRAETVVDTGKMNALMDMALNQQPAASAGGYALANGDLVIQGLSWADVVAQTTVKERTVRGVR